MLRSNGKIASVSIARRGDIVGGRYLIEEHRRGACGQMPGCHVTDVVVELWNALEDGNDERTMHIYKEMGPLFHFERPIALNTRYHRSLKKKLWSV